MKKTAVRKNESVKQDALRSEYRFDHSKSKPNRFAAEMPEGALAVVLEPDVASVFKSSETVNAFLQSMISAMPPSNVSERTDARQQRLNPSIMTVRLKKRSTRYRDLSIGQPYAVIGIEADEFRILNDAGRPFLYPPTLFSILDKREPADWVTEIGDDGERYSYAPPLNKPGFFEDFFEQKATAVATFWQVVNRRLPASGELKAKRIS